MKKQASKNFYNEGFGWVCKNCESNLKIEKNERSRLMKEGEAESKTPVFSNKAMVKWANDERNTLLCPKCEIKETLA